MLISTKWRRAHSRAGETRGDDSDEVTNTKRFDLFKEADKNKNGIEDNIVPEDGIQDNVVPE